MVEWLKTVIDLKAKRALERLARHYGVTQRAARERMITETDGREIAAMEASRQADYYCDWTLRRNVRPKQIANPWRLTERRKSATQCPPTTTPSRGRHQIETPGGIMPEQVGGIVGMLRVLFDAGSSEPSRVSGLGWVSTTTSSVRSLSSPTYPLPRQRVRSMRKRACAWPSRSSTAAIRVDRVKGWARISSSHELG